MKLRTVPLSAFLWEAGRYILLMNLLQRYLNPLGTSEYGFFFFWIGSYAFFMMLVLGMAFFKPEKFGVLVPAAGLGKLLQTLAGVLFVLYEYGVVSVLTDFLRGGIDGLIPASLLGGTVPAALMVVLLDLISGIFLLLYTPGQTKHEDIPDGAVPLDITDVEEE